MRTTKSVNNSKSTLKKVLSLTTVGAIAAVPFFSAATSAQADPPRHAPAHGYRNKNHGKDTSRDRRDRNNRDRNDRWNDRRDDRWDRRRDDRRDNDYRSYSGTVTRVRGSRDFDIRANGRTYNVSTDSRLPRGLDRGDTVRVYGERAGDNNIKNARVSITRNR
jgi:hypothetical protein